MNAEFRGNWVLSDRQYVLTFPCGPNINSSNYQYAWNLEPYDFSVSGNVTFNYAWDVDFKAYSALTIDVSGASPAATTAAEVVAALNANATFSEMFVAQVKYFLDKGTGVSGPYSVLIVPKPARPKNEIRLWISNSVASYNLGFNKKAPVAELPTYMDRHTIANRYAFPDSVGMLIALDENDPLDQDIIEDAGFVIADMKADWQLLEGRAYGLFLFRKQTIDGQNRVAQIIEYGAGASVGGFARKINYSYTPSTTQPYQITEVPYVLTSGDLITPP